MYRDVQETQLKVFYKLNLSGGNQLFYFYLMQDKPASWYICDPAISV